MIVNPQFFNYRLIIGSLIVAIAILSVFSFRSYESGREHQQFIEQEKKLVESELSQLIEQYDDVASTNSYMVSKLKEAKKATKMALDSLLILKSDISVVSKFKAQLLIFKNKNEQLFGTIDSLRLVNVDLQQEKLLVHQELKKQLNTNSHLKKNNQALNKTLEKASVLTANSFKATAYLNSKGRLFETKKANRTETFQVCFSLAENTLTESGKKELYIQIVNPENNVVANQGFISFGDSSLIYSTKTVIDYHNKELDVCTNIIAANPNTTLPKGTYFVSVFHKDHLLGNTQIELK